MATSRWPHQEEAFRFAVDRRAAMLAMWMGTGKSKVATDLLLEWNARRTLILCPVSVMAVWLRELAKWGEGDIEVLVLDKGTVEKKAATATLWMAEPTSRLRVVVINYESARMPAFARWAVKQAWDAVVLDESHRCKAPHTAVSKFVSQLGEVAQRRLCLTGTPMPHSPLDVFGQCRFLDANLYGRSWFRFKQQYAVCGIPTIPSAVTGYRNLPQLRSQFAKIAYQVGPEVLELLPVRHHQRTFTLEPKVRALYDSLERDFIAQLGDGVVTAANVLVKLLRLRQVVSGFLQADGEDAVEHLHSGKDLLLRDLLEDLAGEPVVVFAEFRTDLNRIRAIAEKLDRTYGEISSRAKCLTEHATMPSGVDVLGVQYQSGGVGIDLTRARYAIYYSPTYSLGNYDQSLARLHRPGQTSSVQFYHLVCEQTVDEQVYLALQAKRDVIESVLSNLSKEGTHAAGATAGAGRAA